MKVIQIAVAECTDDVYDTLFALCDDGSIWWMVRPTSDDPGPWTKLPPIPDVALSSVVSKGGSGGASVGGARK